MAQAVAHAMQEMRFWALVEEECGKRRGWKVAIKTSSDELYKRMGRFEALRDKHESGDLDAPTLSQVHAAAVSALEEALRIRWLLEVPVWKLEQMLAEEAAERGHLPGTED